MLRMRFPWQHVLYAMTFTMKIESLELCDWKVTLLLIEGEVWTSD